jgi:hypothetical protein
MAIRVGSSFNASSSEYLRRKYSHLLNLNGGFLVDNATWYVTAVEGSRLSLHATVLHCRDLEHFMNGNGGDCYELNEVVTIVGEVNGGLEIAWGEPVAEAATAS